MSECLSRCDSPTTVKAFGKVIDNLFGRLKYLYGLIMLNFSDLTRNGVLTVISPLKREELSLRQTFIDRQTVSVSQSNLVDVERFESPDLDTHILRCSNNYRDKSTLSTVSIRI